MEKQELIDYWVQTSENDYLTMQHLYDSGDYHWCLFMGHLVVEKLLKALFVSVHGISTITPRIHNLLVLAKKANLDLTEKQEDLLDLISTFNINARYGDYKQAFYKKCTQKYTQECKKEIEVLVVWLKSLV